MTKKTHLLALLIPVASMAQNYPGMNQADMQKMMQQAQKMQACMRNVDQSQLKVLEQRSKKMQSEINALCASGKRDAAQSKAIAFGQEVAKDTTLQSMRKCGEMMQGMMPNIANIQQHFEQSSRSHVCDEMKRN